MNHNKTPLNLITTTAAKPKAERRYLPNLFFQFALPFHFFRLPAQQGNTFLGGRMGAEQLLHVLGAEGAHNEHVGRSFRGILHGTAGGILGNFFQGVRQVIRVTA